MAFAEPKTLGQYFKLFIFTVVVFPSYCFASDYEQEFLDFDPSSSQNIARQAQARVCEGCEESVAMPSQLEYPSAYFEQIKAEQMQDYSSDKRVTYRVPAR